MFAWFTESMASLSPEFSDTAPSDSPVLDCWRPTVRVSGREKDYYDEVVPVRAVGQPWGDDGTYRWEIVSGSATLSSRSDAHIEVRRTSPGTVRLMVTYSTAGKTSDAAYHIIQFLAHPVYVVGGGAAGLKAAEHLLSNGYKVVLCEATGRLGGRARTLDAMGGTFKVDLGCQWLHGEEWKWEVGQKGIANKGFRIDDQRKLYPQLDALWPWPADVRSVFGAAQGIVEEALEEGYDDRAADTHVVAFDDLEDYPTAEMTKVYEDRRTEEVNQKLDELVTEQHENLVQAAHDDVKDPAVLVEARKRARAAFSKVDLANFKETATSNVGSPEVPDFKKKVTQEQVRLSKVEQQRLGGIFDQGGSDIDRLIGDKIPGARTALETERLKVLERELRDGRREVVEEQFDEDHRDNFNTLCERAYKIARNMEGPLEEAAEWDSFCNIDRNEKDASLGAVTEEGCGVQQSGTNDWCLDGYGGLIEAYGAYLKDR